MNAELRCYILSICCVVLLPGCLTLNQFNKVMSTPNITPQITRDALGKPKNEEHFGFEDTDFKIMHYLIPGIINDNAVIAIFANDKLFLYGADDDYTLIKFLYKAQIIDKDEYRWRYEMLQREDIARRQELLQMFNAMQNASYQQKSIDNQETMIQSINQPIYTQGTIQKIGDTYRYRGTSQPMILPSQ